MKIALHSILEKLNISKLRDPGDIFFVLSIGFFGVIALFELTRFIFSYYTFARATALFFLLNFFYILKRLYSSGFFSANPTHRVSTTFHLGKNTKNIEYIINISFYGFLGFVVLFVIASFFYPIDFRVLNTIFLGLIILYTVWKLTGNSFDTNFVHQFLVEKTFLKFLIMTSGLCFIVVFSLSQGFPGQNRTLFILTCVLVHILGFTFLFSSLFQNISLFFSSGKYYLWFKSNLRLTLSVVLLCTSLSFIAGRSGVFDFLFIKKIENIAEFVPRPLEIEIVIPEVSLETQLVSQAYDLASPMKPGDSGPRVEILQQAMKKLGTYEKEVSSFFDEETRLSLRKTLIDNCSWPESTKGIFGPQAKACLDSLEITK